MASLTFHRRFDMVKGEEEDDVASIICIEIPNNND